MAEAKTKDDQKKEPYVIKPDFESKPLIARPPVKTKDDQKKEPVAEAEPVVEDYEKKPATTVAPNVSSSKNIAESKSKQDEKITSGGSKSTEKNEASTAKTGRAQSTVDSLSPVASIIKTDSQQNKKETATELKPTETKAQRLARELVEEAPKPTFWDYVEAFGAGFSGREGAFAKRESERRQALIAERKQQLDREKELEMEGVKAGYNLKFIDAQSEAELKKLGVQLSTQDRWEIARIRSTEGENAANRLMQEKLTRMGITATAAENIAQRSFLSDQAKLDRQAEKEARETVSANSMALAKMNIDSNEAIAKLTAANQLLMSENSILAASNLADKQIAAAAALQKAGFDDGIIQLAVKNRHDKDMAELGQKNAKELANIGIDAEKWKLITTITAQKDSDEAKRDFDAMMKALDIDANAASQLRDQLFRTSEREATQKFTAEQQVVMNDLAKDLKLTDVKSAQLITGMNIAANAKEGMEGRALTKYLTERGWAETEAAAAADRLWKTTERMAGESFTVLMQDKANALARDLELSKGDREKLMLAMQISANADEGSKRRLFEEALKKEEWSEARIARASEQMFAKSEREATQSWTTKENASRDALTRELGYAGITSQEGINKFNADAQAARDSVAYQNAATEADKQRIFTEAMTKEGYGQALILKKMDLDDAQKGRESAERMQGLDLASREKLAVAGITSNEKMAQLSSDTSRAINKENVTASSTDTDKRLAFEANMAELGYGRDVAKIMLNQEFAKAQQKSAQDFARQEGIDARGQQILITGMQIASTEGLAKAEQKLRAELTREGWTNDRINKAIDFQNAQAMQKAQFDHESKMQDKVAENQNRLAMIGIDSTERQQIRQIASTEGLEKARMALTEKLANNEVAKQERMLGRQLDEAEKQRVWQTAEREAGQVYQSEEERRKESFAAIMQAAGFKQEDAARAAGFAQQLLVQSRDQAFTATQNQNAQALQERLVQSGYDNDEKMARLNQAHQTAMASAAVEAAGTAAEKAFAYQKALLAQNIDGDTAKMLAEHQFQTSEREATQADQTARTEAENKFKLALIDMGYKEDKAAVLAKNAFDAAENEKDRKSSEKIATITGKAAVDAAAAQMMGYNPQIMNASDAFISGKPVTPASTPAAPKPPAATPAPAQAAPAAQAPAATPAQPQATATPPKPTRVTPGYEWVLAPDMTTGKPTWIQKRVSGGKK